MSALNEESGTGAPASQAVVAPESGQGPAPDSRSLHGLLTGLPLRMRVALGYATMPLNDVFQLGVGAVIEIDRAANSPVDIWIDDVLVARGRVAVYGGKYGVEIISRNENPRDGAKEC